MRLLDSIDELDFRDHLRPGDRVVWGQACGEPRTLVRHLFRSPIPPGLSVFLGIDVANSVRVADAARVRLTSYIGSGANSVLHAAGLLDILPWHYSMLPGLVTGADVVFVRTPPPGPDGRVSLGTNVDYLADALVRARVVIAEFDDRVPETGSDVELSTSDIDVAVPARHGSAELATPPATDVQHRIAAHVAELVDDGSTLQVGVGSLTDAVLAALVDRRQLGLHSGLIPDGVVDLMNRGVLTGERKILDRGVSVGGMLLGSRRLFEFAHRNPRISLRGARYTHDHGVLAQQPKLVAINSALEVDLTGQINSEVAQGRYVGAVGGAVDFLRGAAASPGGVPIVMLPSGAGPTSRIVARLSGPVSTPRSDAGVIVTEHGRADLRGLSLSRRVEAMIAIAAPAHRARLSSAADAVLAAVGKDADR
ncbi:MAG TPA: acetyl-CoA hydrolase/transferase C-terminal domain-containing protein [Amycolatopsis sp.]|nr:acetyl-CoA hydrolase/transferase C-terminal domain-containing protein [Amycolatopsis sp.]